MCDSSLTVRTLSERIEYGVCDCQSGFFYCVRVGVGYYLGHGRCVETNEAAACAGGNQSVVSVARSTVIAIEVSMK